MLPLPSPPCASPREIPAFNYMFFLVNGCLLATLVRARLGHAWAHVLPAAASVAPHAAPSRYPATSLASLRASLPASPVHVQVVGSILDTQYNKSSSDAGEAVGIMRRLLRLL